MFIEKHKVNRKNRKNGERKERKHKSVEYMKSGMKSYCLYDWYIIYPAGGKYNTLS
jgi:hypothetical protein